MNFFSAQAYTAALERFATGELSLDELHHVLTDIVGSPLRVNENMRWFPTNGVSLGLSVQVTRYHLDQILRRRGRRQFSEEALVDWATMIMVNEAFSWDWQDDVLTDWINRLALDLPGC
jgi:hypothetical protein